MACAPCVRTIQDPKSAVITTVKSVQPKPEVAWDNPSVNES